MIQGREIRRLLTTFYIISKSLKGEESWFKISESLTMEVYTNSNYACLLIDIIYISCYCTLLCENLVAGRIKKYSCTIKR